MLETRADSHILENVGQALLTVILPIASQGPVRLSRRR